MRDTVRGFFGSENLVGLVSGPIIWSVHFLTVYVFLSIGCALGLDAASVLGINAVILVLVIATVAALGAIAAGAIINLREWRLARALSADIELNQRARFMAQLALVLSVLSFVATLWTGLPILMLPPCQ